MSHSNFEVDQGYESGINSLVMDCRRLDLALFLAGEEVFQMTNRCPYEIRGYECGADEPCEDQTDAPECWNAYWKEKAKVVGE